MKVAEVGRGLPRLGRRSQFPPVAARRRDPSRCMAVRNRVSTKRPTESYASTRHATETWHPSHCCVPTASRTNIDRPKMPARAIWHVARQYGPDLEVTFAPAGAVAAGKAVQQLEGGAVKRA